MAKLKEAHKAQDLTQIDAAVAEMNAAWTVASEEMYKATQDGGGAPPQGDAGAQQPHSDAGANTENVTDAEFEEVK